MCADMEAPPVSECASPSTAPKRIRKNFPRLAESAAGVWVACHSVGRRHHVVGTRSVGSAVGHPARGRGVDRMVDRRAYSHLTTAVVRHVRADWAFAVIDAALVSVAWTAALVLRYDAEVPGEAWEGLWSFLPLALGVTMVSQVVAGLYSGVWRFASVHEARLVVGAQVASLMVLAPAVLILDRPVPGSVLVMATVIATALVGAVRFQSRLFAFHRHQSIDTAPLVVIGAGSAGVALTRNIRQQGDLARVVAFLDDDPRLRGRKVQGVVVRGSLDDLPEVVRRTGATHAVLAMPSASSETVRRAAALADETGVALRVVPPLSELVSGQVMLRDVRDLEISDLLGRDQVETDLTDIVDLVRGLTVLVTGAGGSIGSEIARQVTRLGAARVVLLDHDETHLFDTAAGLPPTVVQRLADIREASTIDRLFQQERPDLVFHAAAHKHVPLLEKHPVEAAQTNVLGTRNVVRAAQRHGVRRFVFISTDKAVRPNSVMGASKNVGEQVVLGGADSMTCCAVRFGNVLGSRGSVVPTFVRQIRDGGPVTITDARMTRYFMSIPEAVRLVLHAAALARGGEVFMLDMGEPVRILDLAHRMIRLSGRRPGLDVEIRVTGIRPGEKLSEELHTADERQHHTSHPAIVRLDPVTIGAPELDDALAMLITAAAERDDSGVRAVLARLVGGDLVGISARVPGEPPRVEALAWT
ncbi:MAG: NAD-dependent epimerase/dehydratase family protein [Propionibacteriales bacterium]|nr:NAD-dependent epimerase/dehydratase family protein [Propionibacteriales bacterium]